MGLNKNGLKWLAIPNAFVGNILLYSLIGFFLDKKFDIGNYIIAFIFLGFFMGFYSVYKMIKRFENEDKFRSKSD